LGGGPSKSQNDHGKGEKRKPKIPPDKPKKKKKKSKKSGASREERGAPVGTAKRQNGKKTGNSLWVNAKHKLGEAPKAPKH